MRKIYHTLSIHNYRGGFRGGGRTRRAPPLKLVKIWFFFGVKSWFFTWNSPKISRAPPKIGKNMIFFGVKSWFFTWNTPKIFAPPSALRNFFKCAPPNLKSWIRPWTMLYFIVLRKLRVINQKFDMWGEASEASPVNLKRTTIKTTPTYVNYFPMS